MANYLIKKDEKTNEIIYMEYELEGYDFSPRIKNDAYIKIKHVTLIKPAMIEKILLLKLKKQFKKVAFNNFHILNDEDAGEEATILALDETRRLKSIILSKYHKFLRKTVEKEYLKQLTVMEHELEMKIYLIRQRFLVQEQVEEKSRGR